MAVSIPKLKKAISEILDVSDLDTITTKKVREQVEKKLGISLSDRRAEVDKLVMDTLHEKRPASDEEEEEEEESEEEKKPAKRGRKPAAAAKNGSDSGSEDEFEPAPKKGRKAAAAKGKKAGGGGGGRKPGTGYTKECKLSAELAAVVGQPTMARHEVVKQIWKLVKEKNLYDPKNKQFAICNDELLPVIGVKRFRTFGMMKYLKHHFLAD